MRPYFPRYTLFSTEKFLPWQVFWICRNVWIFDYLLFCEDFAYLNGVANLKKKIFLLLFKGTHNYNIVLALAESKIIA
jgi:hypothetical protein